jgi:periplasmic protein TonB
MSHPVSALNLNRLPRLAAPDRLIIAVFLAAVVHAALILGIRFDLESPKPKKVSRTLDITLVTQPSKNAPKKAEVLAQENQIGAGDNKKKAKPAIRKQPQPVEKKVTKRPQPSKRKAVEPVKPSKPAPVRREAQPVLTQSQSKKKIAAVPTRKPSERPVEKKRPALSAANLSRQIAQVGAEYSRATAQYAKRKKIVFINSVNAHKYTAAAYERAWQNKVERIGNLNFPEEARRKKLSGNLLLSVGINKDGTIYSIEVRRSSGHKVLDDAAKRIVRLAAPFAPFPKSLREQADVLVITRTWKFSNDTYQLSNR